jgi:uncharacterized membrane protein YqjE
MPDFSTGSRPPRGGVVESVRSFLAGWVGVLKTRVEIFSTEIEEQREWLQLITIFSLGAIFFLALGILLLTLFIVVLAWGTPAGPWVLGAFAFIYLLAGIIFAFLLRQKLAAKPKIFSATVSELEKDFSALNPD